MKSKDWAFFAAGAVGTTACLLFAILCGAIVLLKPEIPALPISAARTPAPAPPLAAELRGVIYHDDFSSKAMSAANGWRFDSDEKEDKGWSPNKLTIAIKQANLRQSVAIRGDYKDFGIEIEAQPEDKHVFYGIEFRATNHSEKDKLYLFLAMPAGGYALEKRIDGKYVRPVPVEYTESPHLKRGASKNRLGVLAEGSTISLYINGHLVKTLSDNSLSSGTIRVVVGTFDNTRLPAKVDFSRVTVFTPQRAKVDLAKMDNSTAAALAGVLFYDDFSSEQVSEDKGWEVGADKVAGLAWSPNKLTFSIAKARSVSLHTAEVPILADFGYEVEAQPENVPGTAYGFQFRLTQGGGSFYLFMATVEGEYYLSKAVAGQPNTVLLLPPTSSPRLNRGAALNRLGVMAQGSAISLFVNGVRVAQVTDDSIREGYVNLAASADAQVPTRVTFSRATIVTLEKAKSVWEAGK